MSCIFRRGPTLFERYYRELLNFLALRVRDRETAADLTQESFARVYASQQSGTAVRDPRALLYRVARNLLIDGYRRGETPSARDLAEGGEGPVEPDDQAGPEALEPEHALAARQRFEAIAAIVDSLPARCREAFILVKFDGLAHAEAAARMGIAVKTVEMQLQIAMDACWDRMDALESSAARGARKRKTRARTAGSPTDGQN